MDDSEVVAEPLDLAHDVGREDDGLPAVPAVADEADDRARGHHIEPRRGLVENHDRTSVRAMEVFCFMPVESLSHRRSRKPSISRRLKMSSMRFLSVGSSRPFRRPKYSTSSWAVRRG